MTSPTIDGIIETTLSKQVVPRRFVSNVPSLKKNNKETITSEVATEWVAQIRSLAEISHQGLIEARLNTNFENEGEFDFAEVFLLCEDQGSGGMDHPVYKNISLVEERHKARSSYEQQGSN